MSCGCEVKKDEKKIDEWDVESAMNDMMRVEKHKKNAELMKKVHDKMDEQMGAMKKIRSIPDLKTAYDEIVEKKNKE